LLQATAQLVHERPEHTGESVAAYRRSWLHGFAVSVHRRLCAAERRAAEAATSGDRAPGDGPGVGSRTELVLADRRDRVDRAYAEAFPALGRGRRPMFSGSGYPAGTAAGDRADLGARPVSGRRALGA
jgi:hypothetical protein